MILFPFQIFAQCDSVFWSTDPSENLQVSTWGLSPVAVSDEKGGVYIAWESFDYEVSDVYLQYVDRCGDIRWSSPELVGDVGNFQEGNLSLVEDGSGGVIAAWDDLIPIDTIETTILYNGTLRVQRVDSMGNKLWVEEGVQVSLDSIDQRLTSSVSDDSGGTIVLFTTHTDYYTFYDSVSLRIQRISSDGERMWGESGVLIYENLGSMIPLIVSNNESGAIIHYWTGSEIRFEKIDSTGNVVWTIPSVNAYSTMIADNTGGAFLGSPKYIGGGYRQIIANNLSENGDFVWREEGIILSDSVQNTEINISLNESKESTFVWSEIENTVRNINTQRITDNGEVIWNENIIVSLDTAGKREGPILSSNNKNTIYIWIDFRNSGGDPFGVNLFSQKVDSSGERLWSDEDVAITLRHPSTFQAVSDKHNGAIIIWSEEPIYGIFAQQVSTNGNLGEVNVDSVSINVEYIFPNGFYLEQNFPNPFNNVTSIEYYLPYYTEVAINIHDILGNEIKTIERFHSQAGKHIIKWSGKDMQGNYVGSGIYFYQIITEKYRETKKMIYLR